MKKFLFALLLLPFISKAQVLPIGASKGTVRVLGKLSSDTLLILPNSDTTTAPKILGGVIMKTSDKKIYVYTGTKWAATSDGALVTESDPTVPAFLKLIVPADTVRWAMAYVDSVKRVGLNVYTYKNGAATLAYTDSIANVSGKLDSIRRSSDSVYWYAGGSRFFAFRDSTGGEANTGANMGSGAQVFQAKVGLELRFKTILSGNGNITITPGTNDITLTGKSFVDSVRKKSGTDSVFFYTNGTGSFGFKDSAIAGGEINTISSVGAGTSIVKGKTGVDLQLKSLTSDTTIALTGNTNDVQVKVDQTRIASVGRLADTATAIRATIAAGDTIYVKNAGDSGISLFYIQNDSLKLKKVNGVTQNADSSLTFSGGGGSQTLAQVLATGRTLPTNDSVGLSGKYFKFYGNTSNVTTEGLYLGKRQFDNATNAGWYPLIIEPMSTDAKAPNWYWKLNQTVQTGTYPNNVMKMGWNPDLIQTNKMALWDAFESYYSPGGGTDSILERHFSIQGPGFGEVRLGSWTAYVRNGVLGENNSTNLFSNFDLRAETFNIYTTTNRSYASFAHNKTSRVSSFQLQSGNGTLFTLSADSTQGLITFSQSFTPTPRIVDFFKDGNTRDVNMYGLKISTLFGTQFEGYAGPDTDSLREFGSYTQKFKRGYFGTVASTKQIVGNLVAWGNFTPSAEQINWTIYADNTSNFLKMYGVGGSGTKLTIQNNGAIGSATKSGYLTAIDLSESSTDTLLWPRWGQVLQKLAAVGGTTLYTGDGSVSGSRTVTLGTNTFTFSSNSASKFHIASNGKVSIAGTNNSGYDFNVNGQLGVTGTGYEFGMLGTSGLYFTTTADNTTRWIGNSKEFRQIISGTDISFSPYTDNTLPYRIKDFGGTTRFEVDFATPQIALTARLKLNGTRAATSNDVKLLVKGESDSTVAQLDFPIVQTSYTPTRTDVTNIGTASVTTSYYQRTGNKIEVWGEVTIDPTATGDTQITLSLPIASSMSNSYDLSGSAAAYDVNQSARIYYSGGVAVVRLNAADALSHVYSYRYVYYYFAP